METIFNEIKKIAKTLSKNQEQALKTVLETPNWENAVKEFFKTKQGEREATNLAKPLLTALLLLSQAAGATQAPDLINFIKDQVKQEQTVQPTKSDLDGIREAIPFDFGAAEEAFLKAPVVNKNMAFNIFKHQLEKKVRDGLKKTVLPYINKNPQLKDLAVEKKAELIVQEFKNKVNENVVQKKMLNEWLAKVDKNMDDVNRIVKNAVHLELSIMA